jgi:DNA-binding transcriptional LysR family regulator
MPRRASLSFDLLNTLLTLRDQNWDAIAAAAELKINQPSMSKRLAFLQHTGPVLRRPWLERDGKQWRLTEEGERALPAIEELVKRYDQLLRFVNQPHGPEVAFACGQESAATLVLEAASIFRQQHPDIRLRISTLRGETRIIGVATGSLNLAIVSHGEDDIHEIGHRQLIIEPLFSDQFVLVGVPGGRGGDALAALSAGTSLKPKSLAGLPLILPESGSSFRKSFDQAMQDKGLLHNLDIMLEVGGWVTLLAYVAKGFGVGVVPESALASARSQLPELIVRKLDRHQFPPRPLHLIMRRKVGSRDEADLSPAAAKFRTALVNVAQRERE